MSSLALVQRTFDWGGMALAGEEGVGAGDNSPPNKYVKKVLISRQTLGHLSTLDVVQTFESTFYQLSHCTNTFPSFLGYQSRVSKHKN